MDEIRANYKPWANVDNGSVALRRLSGLSNACYKVEITKGTWEMEHKVILFRRFENKICDADFEHLVFKSMSDQRKGPKLLFYNGKIRMEEFIDGRVLSIWECRNPLIMEVYAEA
jgi:predicted Ser/Thr protein kinase